MYLADFLFREFVNNSITSVMLAPHGSFKIQRIAQPGAIIMSNYLVFNRAY